MNSVEEKAEKWDTLTKRLASGVDGKGYDIRQVTMKGWDEIFASWEKLEAIKTNLTHMVGILDSDMIHANTMIKIEYAKELLEIIKSSEFKEKPDVS